MTLLQNSLRFCRVVARKSGSSFASAFVFLPQEKRNAMEVLYAFMRLTDDLADDTTCSLSCRRERLAHWQGHIEQMFDGDYTFQTESTTPSDESAKENVFPALGQVCKQFDIPRTWLLDVVRGVDSDLVPRVRMNSLDDTIQYCDRVAGTVGLAVLAIFGCDCALDETRIHDAAIACGRAFQWTNFLRDTGEDLAAERVYFPLSDFESSGWSLDSFLALCRKSRKFIARSHVRDNENARDFFRLQNDRANQFYEQSESLRDHINPDCRDVYILMRQRYRLLFQKLQKDNFQSFYKKVRLSRMTKLRLLVPCFLSQIPRRLSR